MRSCGERQKTAKPNRSQSPGIARALLLIAAIAAWAAAVRAQTTPSAQQAEIERLRIVVEVKQQRIEALERELAAYRAKEKAKRNREIVAEIQDRVAHIRRLPAKQPISVEPLTPEKIDDLIDKELGNRYTKEQFQGYELLLKHLGLIPPKMQLEPFLRALYTEQVAGLYDDESKALYVSDKFDLETSLAKMILAHEICHAFQDQHFDIENSPIHLKTNDDRALAALSVIEGDAMILMSEFLAEKLSWKLLLELPGVLMMDQQQMAAAPPFLTQSMIFPYLQGMTFITECITSMSDQPTAVRDRLMREFPRSTEQVMHPRKYWSRRKDEPTEISLDALTSAGLIPAENQYNNVAGEFGIQLMLREKLPFEEAREAAAGWDGDRVVFGGTLEGDYAMAWLSVWDSERDAGQFTEALVGYYKAQRPDLTEREKSSPARVWLADERGWVAIAGDGARVLCAHARGRERTDVLVNALLSLAAEIRAVP